MTTKNANKKRIVLAITLAEPGGATSFVFGFACWLKAHGHEVTVVAGEGNWLVRRCETAGIPFVRTKRLKREISPWNDLLAVFELRRLFRELRPDAIHLNSTKMGAIGSLAARCCMKRNACRVVYRIGGWVFLEPLPTLRKQTYLCIERLTARFKDTIVCVHPGDETVARERCIKPRDQIITVANGIDLSMFDAALQNRSDARHKLTIDENTFVFGTIANFYPAKDLPRYLAACAIVAKQEPRARFLIIGEGNERVAIERERTRWHLETSVSLPGARDGAAALLRGFDAFVLPSAKEGMSWSLLEAMAASLPCIVTDVGANAWSLGKNGGWIVENASPEKLAAAMLDAMRHPDEALNRGKNARRQIEARFPLEKTYEKNAETLIG